MGHGDRLAVAPDELILSAAAVRAIAAGLDGSGPGDPPLGEAACAAALREVGRLVAQAQTQCADDVRSLALSLVAAVGTYRRTEASAVPRSPSRGGS